MLQAGEPMQNIDSDIRISGIPDMSRWFVPITVEMNVVINHPVNKGRTDEDTRCDTDEAG